MLNRIDCAALFLFGLISSAALPLAAQAADYDKMATEQGALASRATTKFAVAWGLISLFPEAELG
jgi:hypothetical protein